MPGYNPMELSLIKNKMQHTTWFKISYIASLFILLSSCAAFPWLPERQGTSPIGRLTGGSKDSGSSGNSINLGMVVSISGPLALAGREAIAGAEVAIEQMTEAGGLKGHPVRLIVRDSGATSERAVAEAKLLVADHKVSAIIGPLTSKAAYAVAQAIEGQAMLFAYTANARFLTVPRTVTSLFQIGPSNYMQGKAHAIDLAAEQYTRYFILGSDTDEARGQVDSFKASLQNLKPTVKFAGESWLPVGTNDYTKDIQKALDSESQMVYSTLEGEDLVAFTRQAKGLAFFGKVAFSAPYDVGVLQQLKEEMPSGVRAYGRAPFFAFNTTPVRRFVEKYLGKTGVYPSDTAVLAYEAARAWGQLVATSDSLRWLDLLRRGEGLRFESLVGDVYLRSYDHQSSLGSFIGETKWNDTYGFMIYDKLKYVQAEDLWDSVDDLMAMKETTARELKIRPPAVNLGILTDLTGELATTAKETVTAVEVATDQINKEGGLLGRHIELLKRDSGQEPEKVGGIAEDMILRGRANAIIGPVGNTTAITLTEAARKYGVPFIFHYANSERLTSKLFSERVFQVGPSSYMVGRLRAVDLAEQKYSRYWIVGPRYGAALEESEAFKSWMTKLRPDVKFLGETWLPVANEDYSPAINTILAAKPEMVYSSFTGDDLVRFTRQANKVRFFDQVAFTAQYDVGALEALKRDVPPGVRAVSRAPFFASTDPDMKAFVEKYRERTSIYPSDAAVLAYQSVMLWAKAITAIESFSSLTKTLARDYESPFGLRNVRNVDHQTNSGIFVGYTEWSNEYGFMVYGNMKYLSPEQVMRSPAEAFAIRQAP